MHLYRQSFVLGFGVFHFLLFSVVDCSRLRFIRSQGKFLKSNGTPLEGPRNEIEKESNTPTGITAWQQYTRPPDTVYPPSPDDEKHYHMTCIPMPASLLPTGSGNQEVLETFRVELRLAKKEQVAGVAFYLSSECKSRETQTNGLHLPELSPDFVVNTDPDYGGFAWFDWTEVTQYLIHEYGLNLRLIKSFTIIYKDENSCLWQVRRSTWLYIQPASFLSCSYLSILSPMPPYFFSICCRPDISTLYHN